MLWFALLLVVFMCTCMGMDGSVPTVENARSPGTTVTSGWEPSLMRAVTQGSS